MKWEKLTDLDVANRHFVVSSLIGLDRFKDLADAQRNQTELVLVWVAPHGERLTRAGLSIGKHSLVDAVEGVMHELFNLLIEDSLSGHFWPKHPVIREHFLRSSVHKGLVADFLPKVLILVTFAIFFA